MFECKNKRNCHLNTGNLCVWSYALAKTEFDILSGEAIVKNFTSLSEERFTLKGKDLFSF